MLKKLLLLSLLPFLVYCQLTLVKEGEPKSEIILGENPTSSAQFAAFELQHGIELITGVKLMIVANATTTQETHIYVGIPADGESFKHEKYSIRFKGNNIHLAGNDNPDYTNVDYAKIVTTDNVSVYDLLNVDKLVMSQKAVKEVEEALK